MEEESTSSDIGICGKTQLDTWDNRVCKKFFTSGCEEGENCSQKHISNIKEVVCKYFLIYGKCQRGSSCPFIHELLLEKLPECKNQSINSKCLNPHCKFKHISDKDIKECVYYNAGFCKMGKFCKFKHLARELCREVRNKGECTRSGCLEYHIQDSDEGKLLMGMLEECYYKMNEEDCVDYRDLFQLCFRCMQFGHHPSKCKNPDKSRVIRCYKCMKYGHKSINCSMQYTHNSN